MSALSSDALDVEHRGRHLPGLRRPAADVELGRRALYCLAVENVGTAGARLARLLCGRFALASLRARHRGTPAC